MKTLVVYYSRSGNTRKIAHEIARLLNADVDEIVSLRRYGGVFGYIKAGYHALKGKIVKIKFIKNIDAYAWIIIATPNWGARMASPVLSYLKLHDLSKKNIGVCCVQGGSGGEKVISQVENIIGKKARASLIINQADFKDNGYVSKIKGFCNKLA
jgi:flavodoxin